MEWNESMLNGSVESGYDIIKYNAIFQVMQQYNKYSELKHQTDAPKYWYVCDELLLRNSLIMMCYLI